MTIQGILQTWANEAPQAPAIEAPGRQPMTYSQLWRNVSNYAEYLKGLGIHHPDRVVMCLPNSPEMAVAFLGVACAATCAPLNPEYREREFEFFLEDLQPKALILIAGSVSPARSVAEKLGIRVMEIDTATDGPAGAFVFSSEATPMSEGLGKTSDDDVALILHTSGTTSRPKMVPLTHKNLCVSADSVRQSLGLTSEDRCLNIMPLFHIHGLVAAVLASLSTGACVICTPGFYAPRFFDWIQECRASWYTAVPTMHQAILNRAPENRDIIRSHPLRLIRSSSASLPPQVMAALEETFGAPVLEAYGMTEAAHQMASNPLPPRPRKPGSVGPAAGPDIGIMDEDGHLLQAGERGEVVIQGENVTHGYLNNPETNATAFVGEWFRTGDQGYLDSDGYLLLTGRIKEIINRGGEKVSPREIDEVLLDHPAVDQAVAFAVPDPRLGEDIAAAVVLRPGMTASVRELREFAETRLADFKIPRQIVILDEIPKGPTGKIQRIGLAEKLDLAPLEFRSLSSDRAIILPQTPTEQWLANLWAEVLGKGGLSVHDRFLDLGGDSLLATLLLSRVREALDLEVSIIEFFDAPTISDQARLIEDLLLIQFDEQTPGADGAKGN